MNLFIYFPLCAPSTSFSNALLAGGAGAGAGDGMMVMLVWPLTTFIFNHLFLFILKCILHFFSDSI